MHGFRRILLIFLTIALVAMIAFFSSDTGSKSEGKSREVAVFFLRIWNKEFDALSSAEREALIQKAQLPVRKAAHATEFFALGSVMVLLFAELRRKRPWLWAGGLALAAAALDETHQLFVSGRSASIRDVGIDVAGAWVGVALISWILRKCEQRKNR